MNLVDFLITYLAIGAAFAMRVYFSNRHRRNLFVFRSVVFELVFWFPKWVIWSARKLVTGTTAKDQGPGHDSDVPWYGADVDALVHPLPSSKSQKRFREAAERYAALRTAICTVESGYRPEVQFELFKISGHLNSRTGTSCLYRKNLAKLRHHSLRSAEDLVELAIEVQHMSPAFNARLRTQEFFGAFDDVEAMTIAEKFEPSFAGNTVRLNRAKPNIPAEISN